LPSLNNNRKHPIPGGTHGLTTQAHPTQSTYGCSTTTHCHTRQPEHYCRCRQTQYTHGARNRRTHLLAHKLCTRHGSTTTWLQYTPDTSTRKGTPSRRQALYPSPRISQDGYNCQPEHHCRCRQTQYTHGAHHRRTHRLAHNSAPSHTAFRQSFFFRVHKLQ
jgi:hypothetical protein